eukprot:m.16735 g.16735  ORF g.16735 m.16735 type:complete len:51 (+) comp7215_c0_seq1:128-280(+)
MGVCSDACEVMTILLHTSSIRHSVPAKTQPIMAKFLPELHARDVILLYIS